MGASGSGLSIRTSAWTTCQELPKHIDVGLRARTLRVKTLFLSPLQPKRGGGGGGVGGVSRLRFPPGPHLRSSRFSRHPRLRQAPTRRFAKNRNLRGWVVFVGKRPQGPGGPGPKPWGPGPQAPWRPGPQAPGAWIPPLSPVDFLQAEFLTSCCVSNPWVRVSKP